MKKMQTEIESLKDKLKESEKWFTRSLAVGTAVAVLMGHIGNVHGRYLSEKEFRPVSVIVEDVNKDGIEDIIIHSKNQEFIFYGKKNNQGNVVYERK